eukprot:751553-Hanusia_phi.AAC.1
MALVSDASPGVTVIIGCVPAAGCRCAASARRSPAAVLRDGRRQHSGFAAFSTVAETVTLSHCDGSNGPFTSQLGPPPAADDLARLRLGPLLS